MLEFFRRANERGYSSYFYGDTSSTLAALEANLERRYPGLRFRIVDEQLVRRASNIRRRQLASQFRSIPDSDLTTTDAFVQAVKTVPI